jgi:hypothetical protein
MNGVVKSLRNPAFLVALMLLLATAVAMAVLPGYMNIYLRKLPVESRRHMRGVSPSLPSWEQIGQDRQEAEDILKALGTHNTITRHYIERDPPSGEQPIVVELHIAYYTGMVDTVPHVSDRCMIGGGWQPLTGSVDIPVALDDSRWRRAGPGEGSGRVTGLSEVRLPNENSSAPGATIGLPYGLVAPDDADDKRNNVVEMRISDFVVPKTQAVSIIGDFFSSNHRLTPSANRVREIAFSLEDDYAYYAKVQISVGSVSLRTGQKPRVATAADLARIAGGPGGFVSEVLPEVMYCLPDWNRLEARRRVEREGSGGE